MSTDQKYYRTLIQFEVLSTEPIDTSGVSLKDIYTETIDGAFSGSWKVTSAEEVDFERMSQLLTEQGSDPTFFDLT